jgi:hypothetical protein
LVLAHGYINVLLPNLLITLIEILCVCVSITMSSYRLIDGTVSE